LEEKGDKRNIIGSIIISDGVITEGQTPATINNYGDSPIYTTGLGDTAEALDASILSWNTPQEGYINDTLNIRAEINPASRSEEIEVVFKSNHEIVNSRTIVAGKSYQRKAI